MAVSIVCRREKKWNVNWIAREISYCSSEHVHRIGENVVHIGRYAKAPSIINGTMGIRLDNGKFSVITLTTQQHVNTIANPHAAPAVPTTHVNRMNNITPKMFWMHGRKQPISVPGDEKKRSKANECWENWKARELLISRNIRKSLEMVIRLDFYMVRNAHLISLRRSFKV